MRLRLEHRVNGLNVLALKNHPQGQWLHGYFCSHAQPFPVSVAFLHEKTGSTTTLLKNYRTDLKAALAKLEKVLGWKAVLDSDDLVTVKEPEQRGKR